MKKFLIFILLSLSLISVLLISQVVNSDKPQKGEWNFSKRLIWEVDSAGNDVFGDIQNIAVSGSGDVFVADMKNCLIFMFGPDGKYIKKFGKKGEGPGEIREYFGGDQLHVTSKYVIFADRAMIHYFDLKGNYVKTVPFTPGLRPREFVDSDRFISAPATVDSRSEARARVMLVNVNTGEKTEIASFRPYEKATDTQESGGNQITVGIVIGDITPLMLVRYKNNKLYYGMTSEYALNVCDLKGNRLLRFSNPAKKPNKVSDQYLKELRARLGEVPANILDNIINGLPKNASFFSAFHIDGKGKVYLFESDPDSTSERIIDIYNDKGKFIYKGKLNIGKDRNFGASLIHKDFFYIAAEDEDGNVILSKYRISLPE